MGKTLIVNPGSSSKKYALFEGRRELLSMRFERTEEGFAACTAHAGAKQTCEALPQEGYEDALAGFLKAAVGEKMIADAQGIDTVCIRVVAPGTFFQQHRRIDEAFVRELHEKEKSAPLHIPPLLYELSLLRRALPAARFVAASDSAFHADMPQHARAYSIPAADAQALDLYRFGYHGISIASVMRKTPRILTDAPRIILCHVGSGVSITALQNGKSIDTSMGYAPGSGLIMGSRAGDVDAGALLEIMRARGLRPVEAQGYLQGRGGLFALTGNADLRHVLAAYAKKDAAAKEAFAMFAYQFRLRVGAYIAALGGLDALILTATAAERNPELRELLLQDLGVCGIRLDQERNDACIGRDGIISEQNSPVVVAVIANDEQAEMARIAEDFTMV
jgi:acetate kinase